MFMFDESVTRRSWSGAAGLGMDFVPLIEAGQVSLRQLDPAELSPGEFAHAVRDAADNDKSRIIVIDSLNGYLNAMPSEQYLGAAFARAVELPQSTGRDDAVPDDSARYCRQRRNCAR